jgi:hypothetical protein
MSAADMPYSIKLMKVLTMPEDQRPRPEAITAAAWWGQKLRDLAIALKPVSRISKEWWTAEDQIELWTKTDQYEMIIDLLRSLTEENIQAFERYLAEDIDAEIKSSDGSFSQIASRFGYDIDERLGGILQRAGIETMMGPLAPIFPPHMATIVEPGKVLAFGSLMGHLDPNRNVPQHLTIVEP